MIKFHVKKVKYYGRKRLEILDKDKERAFRRLTGRKTIKKEDKKHLEAITGEKVKLVEPKKEL